MTPCPFLILKSARDSHAESSGQQPQMLGFWAPMATDTAWTCGTSHVNSLPPGRLKLTTVSKKFSLVPSGNTGTTVLHNAENWSWAKFLSQAFIKYHFRLPNTHLWQNLASDVSRVTSSQLQLMLLFFQAKKKVPPARCMCSPSFACLSPSARFLPDTCICACPSHFLSVLVSIQAFWRNQCTCLPRQPFDLLLLPVPAAVSITLPSTYTESIPEVFCQLSPYPVFHLCVQLPKGR